MTKNTTVNAVLTQTGIIPKNTNRDDSDENSYHLELLNSKGEVSGQRAFHPHRQYETGLQLQERRASRRGDHSS